jgi:hypothetical protein
MKKCDIDKHSSLLCPTVVVEEKGFITLTPTQICPHAAKGFNSTAILIVVSPSTKSIKLFSSLPTVRQNMIECLSQPFYSCNSDICE